MPTRWVDGQAGNRIGGGAHAARRRALLGTLSDAVSADISTGGCRLRFGAQWAPAATVRIRFALGGTAAMELDATLVPVDGPEASFAFTDPGSAERRRLSGLVRAYNAAA